MQHNKIMAIEPTTVAAINRVLGAVYLALGLAFIVGSGWWVHHIHLDMFLSGSIAEGRVIENKKIEIPSRIIGPGGKRSLGGVSYEAIVQFVSPTGQTVTFNDMGFNPPSFQVGQKVKLFYDPQNPQAAMVDRGLKNFIIPGVCGVVGLLALLGGAQRLGVASRNGIKVR